MSVAGKRLFIYLYGALKSQNREAKTSRFIKTL